MEPLPDDVGEIVRADHGLWSGDPEGPFQIHVKFEPDEECGIYFTVDSATRIVDSRGGREVDATRELLVKGAWVSVEYHFVDQSCPGQSHAVAVDRVR